MPLLLPFAYPAMMIFAASAAIQSRHRHGPHDEESVGPKFGTSSMAARGLYIVVVGVSVGEAACGISAILNIILFDCICVKHIHTQDFEKNI